MRSPCSVTISTATIMTSSSDRDRLIECCRDWGYFYTGGIHDRKDLFVGKDVLDVGMGQGPHSVFYRVHGARSYTGVDPDMDLDGNGTVRDHTRSHDRGETLRKRFPFSPKEIASIMGNVKYHPCILEELDDSYVGKFDLVVMTMVTEHLQNNPAVISACHRYLKPGGMIWSSHANYYFWNGHHETPRALAEYDKENPQHNKCVGWKHLYPEHFVYYYPNLNRIRIDCLRKVLDKYFEVEWEKDLREEFIPLIPENIRNDFPELSTEDLISHHPIAVGKRRDRVLDTDLTKLEYYHPMSSREKDIRNLVVIADLACPSYPNNKGNTIYRKELFSSVTYKNGELECVLTSDEDIPAKKFGSLGIHFRLYDLGLNDHDTYKFSFEMRASSESTCGKSPKVYTGVTWLAGDEPLSGDYRTYEFVAPFKFSGSSKHRLGLAGAGPLDAFAIRKISFERT